MMIFPSCLLDSLENFHLVERKTHSNIERQHQILMLFIHCWFRLRVAADFFQG